MSRFVDFHCHLDLFPDPAAAIAEAEAAGVYTLTVTTTPKAWTGNLALVAKAKGVRVALGLHPQLIAERADEISLWEAHLSETRYVGEVGLDAGPQYYASFDLQKIIFERILKRCADAGGKILTVHSVRSAKTVLDMIEAHLPQRRGRVVMHWFAGSKSEARRAADLGCYFSVNLAMLESDRGRALVAGLPQERLLTETDGPFTQIGGRPSHPKDIAAILSRVASLRSSSDEAMREIILSNLRRLCSEEQMDKAPGSFML